MASAKMVKDARRPRRDRSFFSPKLCKGNSDRTIDNSCVCDLAQHKSVLRIISVMVSSP